jgi:DNA polymerase-4
MDRQRWIAHVDMDAFFAAIEQRDNPSLHGRPVVVGADPKGGRGRGVVAAASYEARAFGIHSAMPISRAYRLCPQAIYIQGDLDKYGRESDRIFSILERFTPDIEPLSIDEAFLDITRSHHLFGTPEETCRRIKATIKAETGLTASIGLAPNMFTAKIASDLGKPDGFIVVTPGRLLEFLHPLPVSRLWGVGPVTRGEFEKSGIRTIGDLARRPLEEIVKAFGAGGEHAWRLAQGLDPRQVESETVTKSVGAEHTFEEDTSDQNLMLDTLASLSERTSRRLRKSGLSGRTITLKIRFEDFSTHTRAASLPRATNLAEDIYRTTSRRLQEFNLAKAKVRLLGVSVSGFDRPSGQLGLFGEVPAPEEKKENLQSAVDRIKDKFGERAIRRRRGWSDLKDG